VNRDALSILIAAIVGVVLVVVYVVPR